MVVSKATEPEERVIFLTAAPVKMSPPDCWNLMAKAAATLVKSTIPVWGAHRARTPVVWGSISFSLSGPTISRSGTPLAVPLS